MIVNRETFFRDFGYYPSEAELEVYYAGGQKLDGITHRMNTARQIKQHAQNAYDNAVINARVIEDEYFKEYEKLRNLFRQRLDNREKSE